MEINYINWKRKWRVNCLKNNKWIGHLLWIRKQRKSENCLKYFPMKSQVHRPTRSLESPLQRNNSHRLLFVGWVGKREKSERRKSKTSWVVFLAIFSYLFFGGKEEKKVKLQILFHHVDKDERRKRKKIKD